MERISDIADMRAFSRTAKDAGQTLGFVPTMGFLHQGHLALVRAAKANTDKVVVSIFVNPTQFDRQDDLDQYPRDMARDIELLEAEGVDVLFAPAGAQMYSSGFDTAVTVESLSKPLCGAHRSRHFSGVTTVVAKLFNIVGPSRAFFGEKDFQQLAVIRRMVKDLNFDVEIAAVPTVREADGLAFSSRNARLNSQERVAARCLVRALGQVELAAARGETRAAKLATVGRREIEKEQLARVEYMSVCDPETLAEAAVVEGRVLVAMAVWVGDTRLIDNTVISLKAAQHGGAVLEAEGSAERSEIL